MGITEKQLDVYFQRLTRIITSRYSDFTYNTSCLLHIHTNISWFRAKAPKYHRWQQGNKRCEVLGIPSFCTSTEPSFSFSIHILISLHWNQTLRSLTWSWFPFFHCKNNYYQYSLLKIFFLYLAKKYQAYLPLNHTKNFHPVPYVYGYHPLLTTWLSTQTDFGYVG